MNNDTVTILLVDDHVLFRDGVRTLLMGNCDFELVGEAESGEEALQMADTLQPDLVLMDIQLPGVNGIETTRHIVKHSPHIYVMIVTMFDDDQSVFAAMRAGARGYILKGTQHDDMLRAIYAAGAGQAIFSAGIASRMIGYFTRTAHDDRAELFPQLSERERYILTLIAQGKNNNDVAQTISVNVKTVQNHVSNILNKLQVTDRAQAILRAKNACLLYTSDAADE